MGWFKRLKEGITTSTREKKETPEGLWYKCPSCKAIKTQNDHMALAHVCDACGYHDKIGSNTYFELLFDNGKYTELHENLVSGDPLHFTDTKKYTDRLRQTITKTGLHDALRSAYGFVNEQQIVICCMDFEFIGGSMGSVVGEKISRAIDFCISTKSPLLIISRSGGARMMEAAFSLMQMAKTSAKLSLMSKHRLPYISLLTNPTTGGVTASYAMLGDINIAEPGALIGFAGPRVVKETIGKDLPKGFQTAEFVLEHGFIDKIVHRNTLKSYISTTLKYLTSNSSKA